MEWQYFLYVLSKTFSEKECLYKKDFELLLFKKNISDHVRSLKIMYSKVSNIFKILRKI